MRRQAMGAAGERLGGGPCGPIRAPPPVPTLGGPAHPTVGARVAQHAVTAQQVIAHERRDAVLPLPPSLQHLRLRLGRRLPGEIVHFWGEKGTRDPVLSPKQAASRAPRPRPPRRQSSPAPFRAMLPWSPLGSTEVTHRQSAGLRLRPLRVGRRGGDEGGNDARRLPGSRGAPREACVCGSPAPRRSRPQREPRRRDFPAGTPPRSRRTGVTAQAPFCAPAPPRPGFPFPRWPDL